MFALYSSNTAMQNTPDCDQIFWATELSSRSQSKTDVRKIFPQLSTRKGRDIDSTRYNNTEYIIQIDGSNAYDKQKKDLAVSMTVTESSRF